MPLESAAFVNALVSTNPANADPLQQGADHLRLLKASLLASFPNIGAAVTATPAQINGWEARIAAAETNRARRDIADTFAARMTFTIGADAASFRRGAAELDAIGVGHMWFTSTAPTGYLLLNGQAVSRTTYAALFALWGTTFGVGDGSTTFNVPDRRLRFPVMAGTGLTLNDVGGTITPAINVVAVGNHSHGGGTGATTLTIDQIPWHGHGVNDPGHGHVVSDPGHVHSMGGAGNIIKLGADTSLGYAYPTPSGTYIGWGTLANTDGNTTGISIVAALTGISTQNVGGGSWHNHTIPADGGHTHTATIADGRPPYFVVNFIVRAL